MTLVFAQGGRLTETASGDQVAGTYKVTGNHVELTTDRGKEVESFTISDGLLTLTAVSNNSTSGTNISGSACSFSRTGSQAGAPGATSAEKIRVDLLGTPARDSLPNPHVTLAGNIYQVSVNIALSNPGPQAQWLRLINGYGHIDVMKDLQNGVDSTPFSVAFESREGFKYPADFLGPAVGGKYTDVPSQFFLPPLGAVHLILTATVPVTAHEPWLVLNNGLPYKSSASAASYTDKIALSSGVIDVSEKSLKMTFGSSGTGFVSSLKPVAGTTWKVPALLIRNNGGYLVSVSDLAELLSSDGRVLFPDQYMVGNNQYSGIGMTSVNLEPGTITRVLYMFKVPDGFLDPTLTVSIWPPDGSLTTYSVKLSTIVPS